MLVVSRIEPFAYEATLQEDRFVEWWTAALFACAGLVRLRTAIRTRRLFDGMVGLFCLFVAGEEFSWGQRLLGFTPPDYFLAHNTQQELTLHNFADVFGQPKNVLILALMGFGVLLPLVRLIRPLSRLSERAGATPPSLTLLPWFALAIMLLIWYPVDFTGEWVETFSAALFLVSTPAVPSHHTRLLLVVAATLALGMTVVSSLTARPNQAVVSCAKTETAALLSDVAASLGSYDGLLRRRVHKRVRSAVEDAYFAPDLGRYRAARCEGELDETAARRRRFGIDPWGLPYWVRSEPNDLGTTVTVYSFGPNRRRDHEPGSHRGDDLLSIGRVPAH